MTSALPLWFVVAAIVAWGSFHFAKRDPRSTSWMKIAFATTFLVVFGAALATVSWFSEYIGEGILAYAMTLIILPMAAIGAPVCVGTILGILLGMHRSRDRYMS
jgi:hypothetical protein